MWIKAVSVAGFTHVEEGEIFMPEWIKVYLLLFHVAQSTFASSCATSLRLHHETSALQAVCSLQAV